MSKHERIILVTEAAFKEARGKPTKDNPLVENVKLLGLVSKNGRLYEAQAARTALPKYASACSYFDHSDSPRRFIERFGRFVNPRFVEGDGVRADFRFNPHHPHAEIFLWWLDNDPDGIGFSHAAEGRIERKDGKDVVTEIIEVHSVDLVCDPATTKGIRESHMEPTQQAGLLAPPPAQQQQAPDYRAKLGELIQAIIADATLDPEAIREKVCGALDMILGKTEEKPKEQEEEEGDGFIPTDPEQDDEENMSGDEKKKKKADEQAMRKELDALRAEKALREQTAACREMCGKANLPPALVTDVFVSSLVEAKDDSARRKLIEDRRLLVPKQTPQSLPSGSPTPGDSGAPTLDAFLKTIYGGK